MYRRLMVLITACGIVTSFNFAAIPALISTVARSFAADEFWVGAAVWLYMIPYGFAAPLYSSLSKKVSFKKILLPCVLVFAAANLLGGMARGMFIFHISRFMAGVAGAAVVPLSLILIASSAPPEKRGRLVGAFFAFSYLSSLLGVFLSGLLIWSWIFILPAVAALMVSVALYYFLPVVPLNINQNGNVVISDDIRSRSLFVYIFLISFLFHGIGQWLGVFFSNSHGFSQVIVSMLISASSFSGILGEAVGGLLADRLGKVVAANIGASLLMVSAVMLILAKGLGLLIAIMLAWGLGWSINHAAVSANICTLPSDLLPKAAGLNSTLRFLSGGLGAFVGGIAGRISFKTQFLFFAACFSLLAIFGKRFLNKEA